jgi:uncharacterized membrane protein YqiK
MSYRSIRAEYQLKEQDFQRQLEQVRTEQRFKEEESQRQIEYARKQAEAEAGRLRWRAEASIADLKATISRLEVDLMKVRRYIMPAVSRRLTDA